MRRIFSIVTAAIVVFLGGLSAVNAQGVLIDEARPLPRPIPISQDQQSYKITELAVQARVDDQVADVQVSQTFQNTGSRQMEVRFLFPLPYDGAVDSLTLMVDGKELPAELLPADEARRRYEEIVRRSKDPALLEWMGNGMFQTSVFPVPAGAERKVTLHYSQLLRKEFGVTEFRFPLSTAKYTSGPVENLDIQIQIQSQLAIRNVYSPTHDVTVSRTGDNRTSVSLRQDNQVPASDLRLFYDVDAGKVGTSVLSYRPNRDEDGYFLMMTTPQIPDEEQELAKTVVLVVDKSGSMSGEKIEQAKGAMRFVLNRLSEGDLFNIIAYDSSIVSFRPELETYNKDTLQDALGFVAGLYAGGGTNIHDALTTTLNQLQDDSRPNFVLFLSDGLPTVGNTNESQIAAAVRRANDVDARLLNFGVGFDVNSRLMDRLARENSGASEYVLPEEDIEAYVSRVYNRISAPVLADVEVRFEFDNLRRSDGSPINRVYPESGFDLFAGEQLVMVGRYRRPGNPKIIVAGNVGEGRQRYQFAANLVEHSSDASFAFVEKLWAVRRIGEIIDRLDLDGPNDELRNELVALSTRHGILTPYTSFLSDETVRPTLDAESEAFSDNSALGLRRLRELQAESGELSVRQRGIKQQLKSAPASRFSIGGGGAEAEEYSESFELAVPEGLRLEGESRDNLRISGDQALYRRGRITLTPETADIDLEADKAKIVELTRFSDEYFQVVAKNTAAQNALLSSQSPEEQLLVNFRGQVYLIK